VVTPSVRAGQRQPRFVVEWKMSIQGTFNTAVQAMLSQSQHLSNIGTNIANVNTTGYKTQSTHFQTLLNHVRVGDKRFFTVDTTDTRAVDVQGMLQTTGRTYDLAINGRGFFITNPRQNGSGEWQYTRDGAFTGEAIDSDGDGTEDTNFLKATNGAYVMGWQADESGNIDDQRTLGSLVPVTFASDLTFAHRATTNIELQANLSASSNTNQRVSLPFVDANGNSRTITVNFGGGPDNNYTVEAVASNGTASTPVTVVPPALSFNGVGRLADGQPDALTLTVGSGATAQTLTLDVTGLQSLADRGDVTVQNVYQNGVIEGRLNKTYFNKDGVLIGSFSNGEVRNLFQLPVATFVSENNLEARGGNYFVQSSESGAMTINSLVARRDGTDPMPNTSADMISGALESSNVDLADQFSKMIVTQRAYSSSATVVRTADEMSQQARDLKR